MINVIDVNRCVDHDLVENVKKRAMFLQEEIKKLKVSTYAMKDFYEARIKGYDKTLKNWILGKDRRLRFELNIKT